MVRILIADDREFVRSTLRQVIGQADANWAVCGEAANGREAIDKAVELSPDLIILDVAMPVLDGIGAAKQIREHLRDVPILMYTFMSFEYLEVMAKQAGAQGVVQKGNLRALVAEIRRVLGTSPVAAVDPASSVQGAPLSNSAVSASEAMAASESGALRKEASTTEGSRPPLEIDPIV